MATDKTLWEAFLDIVEPHLPEYLHWNEICWTFVYYLAEIRRVLHRMCRGMESWEIVVNTALCCLAVFLVLEVFRWLYRWIFCQDEDFISRMKKRFFKIVKNLPFLKEKIATELKTALDGIADTAFAEQKTEVYYDFLPKKGFSENELIKKVDEYEAMGHTDWEGGHVSGTVYHGGRELANMLTKVYGKFAWSNPLHPDIFPGIRKMEAEVVQMSVNMFHGGEDACGTTTSGGTESILMACKAYREWGLHEKGISKPEMVVPVTAHAAFDKAAHYFKIKLIHIPLDKKTMKCDIKAMKRAITSNTVAIVGSAPGFPHGIVDPIEDMAKLAKKYKIGLHVDACLGGFLVAFMNKAGYKLKPFDFSVDGVTSISCDTHKYGFSLKGSSVVLYSNKELRHHQFFCAPDWTGGIYACPAIPGSRPGGTIAATWAAMMHMGELGYIASTKKIIETTRFIEQGVRQINGIYVLGDPEVSIVAFASDDFEIYNLSDLMTKRGWNLNSLQFPSAIHICVTVPITLPGVADKFLKDLRECTAFIMKDPKAPTGGVGAIYGMAQSIPDRSMVEELAYGFLDTVFHCKNKQPKLVKNGDMKKKE